MITRAEYEQKIKKHINSNMSKVLSDKWRSKYHIMAPIGWINDPNGLCQFKDQYHVFYQYSPLEAKGGMKFWGHYVSKDLVHFEERDIAIYPDIEEDISNGFEIFSNKNTGTISLNASSGLSDILQ